MYYLYVKEVEWVNSTRIVLPCNGLFYENASCKEIEKDLYEFKYYYYQYKVGGNDTELERKVITTTIRPGEIKKVNTKVTKYFYYSGNINVDQVLQLKLVDEKEADNLMFEDSEKRDYDFYKLMIDNDAEGGFTFYMDKYFKEPEENSYSSSSHTAYELLALAYSTGLSRPVDEMRADLNAFKANRLGVAYPHLIKYLDINKIPEIDLVKMSKANSKTGYYYFSHLVKELGFNKVYEEMLKQGCNSRTVFNEFYYKGNEEERAYFALLNKEYTELLFSKGEDPIEYYSVYLSLKQFEEDLSLYYLKGPSSDEDNNPLPSIRVFNKDNAIVLLEKAKEKGDEFASKILEKYR